MEILFVIGNLGADAELKQENGNEFVKFNVAETRAWSGSDGVKHEETLWNSCIMNGRQEKLLPYLTKGTKVAVIGRASTRVFSSPKERRMVAGINIQVDRLELISVNTDVVPRYIVAPDSGELVPTAKAFFIDSKLAVKAGAKEGVPVVFFDAQGRKSYQVDVNGFVWPDQVAGDAQNAKEETTAAENTVS